MTPEDNGVTARSTASSPALRAQGKFVSEAEFDALLDIADSVSQAAWKSLSGHDCFAALTVIGTLIASVERELGWPRERILEEVSEIADSCDGDKPEHLTPTSKEGE